jgi:hypothetical protein
MMMMTPSDDVSPLSFTQFQFQFFFSFFRKKSIKEQKQKMSRPGFEASPVAVSHVAASRVTAAWAMAT